MARPRLPTNVINGLEDAQALVMDIWPALRAASQRAERYEDPVLLALLNQMALDLNGLERHLRDARAGKYVERR